MFSSSKANQTFHFLVIYSPMNSAFTRLSMNLNGIKPSPLLKNGVFLELFPLLTSCGYFFIEVIDLIVIIGLASVMNINKNLYKLYSAIIIYCLNLQENIQP